MIKKKTILGIILLMGIMLLCACNNTDKDTQDNTIESNETTTEERMTGPPADEVQRLYLYYEDKLYVFADSTKTVAKDKFEKQYKGYKKVGIVETVDNSKIPDTNFAASRTEVGAEIYVKYGQVLIYKDEWVYKMKPVE